MEMKKNNRSERTTKNNISMEPRRKKKKKKHIIRKIIFGILGMILLLVVMIVVLIKKLDVHYTEVSESPKIGEWCCIAPEGTKSSDGSEWHGLIRLGTENKVLVYFYGGGVSFNETTSRNSPDWFFFPTVAFQDALVEGGIFTYEDSNPFKNWTFLAIEYSTGDFHTGQGEVIVKDPDGKDRTVYHNGYNNYSAFMKEALQYIGTPEALMICGSSAGGFATALLSDDLIQYFPDTNNITACVDSSLLYYDGWQETAENIWHSPKEIIDRLTGTNITLDGLTALQEHHPDIKILFTCSTRDRELQRYQAYIDYGKMEANKENSDSFKKGLKKMVDDMEELLTGPGIYLFECGYNKTETSTLHMILPGNVFEKFSDNKSVADWMMDAVNGNIKSYGLTLLNED